MFARGVWKDSHERLNKRFASPRIVRRANELRMNSERPVGRSDGRNGAGRVKIATKG